MDYKKIWKENKMIVIMVLVVVIGVVAGYYFGIESRRVRYGNENGQNYMMDRDDKDNYGGRNGSDDGYQRGGRGQMDGGMMEDGMDPYENGGGEGMRNGGIDRGNCLGDDCLLVEDLDYPAGELSNDAKNALDEAIADEYKARATYEAVMEKFGTVRPFSMIIGAEEQHIASLKTIYDKYGLDAPTDTATPLLSGVTTLQQACQAGVDAEIANADLYKSQLLPAVSDYEDIKAVFTNLMNASQEKHLPAFERCN